TYACVPPSGAFFATGTTPVTCTVSDASSNTASCTFSVTVEDHQAPTIVCPDEIVVNTSPGTCFTNVTFAPTISDNCPNSTYVCVPASGSSFSNGTTVVTCTATDASTHIAVCSFNV